MAESFANTFKRDYVCRMDLAKTRTVMAQMAAAFEHFNEVLPHSALKMPIRILDPGVDDSSVGSVEGVLQVAQSGNRPGRHGWTSASGSEGLSERAFDSAQPIWPARRTGAGTS